MRTLSPLLLAVLSGLSFGLLASVPIARGDARQPTAPLTDIKEGAKGYGLTVFKGTAPEKFPVEFIGIMHNFRPGQDLILIKTPDPRLNVAKTVQGMSGSPIFLEDGRVVGAYSYSLTVFNVEPIAGVTPIGYMLTELARPIPPGFWPGAGPPLPGAGRPQPAPSPRPHASLTDFEGPPGTYDVETHAKQLADRLGYSPAGSTRTMVPLATPLLISGGSDKTAAAMKDLLEPVGLEPLQAGGGTGPVEGAPEHYVNGGPLGVQLVRGDVSAMGLGTATWVVGNKVAGFGHPMMEGGDSALPACIGRVLWLMTSQMISFKVGDCARPLGTLVQDRQTAIVIDESKPAPMFPVDLDIVGAQGGPGQKTHWHSEVALERSLSPVFSAFSLASFLGATATEKRDVTWQLKSKVEFEGHPAVELEDFGVSVGGTPEIFEFFRSRMVRTIGDVLNNPWEDVNVKKVEGTLTLRYARDAWHLRGVELLDPVVEAGQKVRIRLRLLPYLGQELTKVVEVTMPDEVADKDVDVEIIPGYESQPEVPAPENLDELLANETRQSLLPKSVVLQFRVPSHGVAYHGRVTHRLPSYALEAVRATSADDGPEIFPTYARTVIPLDNYVDGRDKVRVHVKGLLR